MYRNILSHIYSRVNNVHFQRTRNLCSFPKTRDPGSSLHDLRYFLNFTEKIV